MDRLTRLCEKHYVDPADDWCPMCRIRELEAQLEVVSFRPALDKEFITELREMAKGWIANRLPPDDPDYLIGESIAKSSCAADITALLEKHDGT